MNVQVYIRADGSSTIGLGHLMRCFALAQMLREHFSIHFICREAPENFIKEITQTGFYYTAIQSESEFHNLLSGNEIVVLDHYGLTSEDQQKIRNIGCKLICVDDMHDKKYHADLIINHAPGIRPGDYEALPDTHFALGPDYALLRPAFLEQARKERKITTVNNVLICFGGADFKNLTESTLKTVMEFPGFKQIRVVTGAAYSNEDAIRSLMKSDPRIIYLHAASENEMLEAMLHSDLAIVPASGVLIEALAVKCMVISGIYVENQQFIYANYKAQGFFIDAVNFETENLKKAIDIAFTIPSGNIQQPIDGKSGERLLRKFRELLDKKELTLRRAAFSDLEITYQWATSRAVRAFSFSTHEISAEEHQQWFSSRLKDNNCLFFIAISDGKPAGSIRFDIRDQEALISYLVAPEFQGQGLGQVILRLGLRELLSDQQKHNIPLSHVTGYVLHANIPSLKAFRRLGFDELEQEKMVKFEKKSNDLFF